MGECSVTLAGRAVGRAVWKRSGARCRVMVQCGFEPGVFYRAVLEADGETWPLGLLVREGDLFVTERWLTPTRSRMLEDAARIRCRIERSTMDGTKELEEPLESALPEPEPPPPFLEPPGRALEEFSPVSADALTDPLLRRLAGERGDLLRCGDLLAMPAREGEDPMAPFFCLMEPARLREAPWYLLTLREGGPVPAGIRQESPPAGSKMDGVIS